MGLAQFDRASGSLGTEYTLNLLEVFFYVNFLTYLKYTGSSKETRRFLDTMPKGRFKFVFTPKHGSWLNMIESFFSKMTRQMLRGIRVNTKEELEERIYKYFDEVNREPVIYRWKYKMDEISEEEAASV